MLDELARKLLRRFQEAFVSKRSTSMKHPVDVHVGKRVRHRRWMVGMTQQQLGDIVGIKFQQIQKYETGMNRISASRIWFIVEDIVLWFCFLLLV